MILWRDTFVANRVLVTDHMTCHAHTLEVWTDTGSPTPNTLPRAPQSRSCAPSARMVWPHNRPQRSSDSLPREFLPLSATPMLCLGLSKLPPCLYIPARHPLFTSILLVVATSFFTCPYAEQ
ncbi:hypothetical protein NEOLEDRAFT_898659 [Neolentinus lepideus HHB14362 ss-1]|uniref:Uncharacterized protein n=1 Tax=Neolentinus lepideus HHB14362 ss-1 TaxID=1314782 RepID=A0A165NRR9_9AGAM|nr:hypothetical protein NEOLEDRAFT_898659 [Neolentinus lepideus HHB14362 ss-1]